MRHSSSTNDTPRSSSRLSSQRINQPQRTDVASSTTRYSLRNVSTKFDPHETNVSSNSRPGRPSPLSSRKHTLENLFDENDEDFEEEEDHVSKGKDGRGGGTNLPTKQESSSSGRKENDPSRVVKSPIKDHNLRSSSALVIRDVFTDESGQEYNDKYMYESGEESEDDDDEEEDEEEFGHRRHSRRLSDKKRTKRRRHYFLDDEAEEDEGHVHEREESSDYQVIFSDDDEFRDKQREDRRKRLVQSRYNLRTHGKRDPRLESLRNERIRRHYNLRPKRDVHPTTPMDKVPWSFVAEYLQAQRDLSTEGNNKKEEGASTNNNMNLILASSLAEEERPMELRPLMSPTAPGAGNVFSRIAGMSDYIRRLKEMIVFPLLYPELFTKLNIAPPRGVLFHGPPGTGKTLLARLLAESCSTSSRKVSFFMRNGSDCLSKWIGEAERNLKMLFQKAKECQPSIIFFDELDGLAPERSGKAEQSHISLVSTLLALMDGLDDRGNVVVIGATNRIQALDPALRRPGRFDREFYFPLPDEQVRRDILQVHTRSWPPETKPNDELMRALANATFGFAGADLKALCTEATFRSIRRCCPQAYEDDQDTALQDLQHANIDVTAEDFAAALSELTPSTRRQHPSESASLSPALKALYGAQVPQLEQLIRQMFGPAIPTGLLGSNAYFLEWNVIQVRIDLERLPLRYAHRIVAAALANLSGIQVLQSKTKRGSFTDERDDMDQWIQLKDAQNLAMGGKPTLLVLDAVNDSSWHQVLGFVHQEMVLSEPFGLLVFTCHSDDSTMEEDDNQDQHLTTFELGHFGRRMRDAFLQEFCQYDHLRTYIPLPSLEQIEQEANRLNIHLDFPIFDYTSLVEHYQHITATKPDDGDNILPLMMPITPIQGQQISELSCQFLMNELERDGDDQLECSIPNIEQALSKLIRQLRFVGGSIDEGIADSSSSSSSNYPSYQNLMQVLSITSKSK